MTTSFEFKQSSHLNPVLHDVEITSLNVDKLVGRWINTLPDTRGLSELVIELVDGRFQVRATGVGDDGPIEWPATTATMQANLEEEEGQRAVALAVTFDFDFMQTHAQIRVNKGIMVTVLFTAFTDDSGRANYVTREFFYLAS